MKEVICPKCNTPVKKCDECDELFYPEEDLYCMNNGEAHLCTLDCMLEYTNTDRVYGEEKRYEEERTEPEGR